MLTDIAQSGMVAFAPRARLLKLLGAELISDEIVAITELVKNAHDADATCVTILFSGVTGEHGEILVSDDGHGMDLDTLMSRWMQPAGSAKGREGRRFTTRGRRVLGEKGVGRFAADKLASHLELVSRPTGAPLEIRAEFDWDEFEHDDRMLSDVRSKWEVRSPDWLESNGTVLRLSKLRASWNERLFRRLSTRLSRLVSPFESGVKGFRIVIESDEFPDYSGEVSAGFLDQAPYRVEAQFDGVSGVSIRVNNGRAIEQVWKGDSPLRCGPVRARMFAFDLETESIARIGPRMEVRAWLREWSGMSVYRDGFRIWPYGEPHDDWLRLDQRRVNNPVVRLSNNQVVGFVEVSADRNPELRDQTNREGLIHNEALDDLQRFILHAMQVLEAERQSQRHPNGKKPERKQAKDAGLQQQTGITDTLDRLAGQVEGDLGDELKRATERVRSQFAAQELTHRRMLDGYSNLAALGHTASLLGRGVNVGVADMRERVTALRAILGRKAVVDQASLAVSVAELETMLELVASQLTMVASPGSSAARRRRGLDVPAELVKIRDALLPVLQQEDAEIEVEVPEGVLLRTEMRPETFASIINVLVRNSLEWRVAGRPLRMIAMLRESKDSDEFLDILFSDNGQGVLATIEDKLLEAGVAGEDGAGMGLAIARNVVTSHGGSIALVIDRRRKGATFLVQLPRKRSRATTPQDT
jgi:hypothetical protein